MFLILSGFFLLIFLHQIRGQTLLQFLVIHYISFLMLFVKKNASANTEYRLNLQNDSETNSGFIMHRFAEINSYHYA